jgi:hypothetical protein
MKILNGFVNEQSVVIVNRRKKKNSAKERSWLQSNVFQALPIHVSKEADLRKVSTSEVTNCTNSESSALRYRLSRKTASLKDNHRLVV